MRIQDRVVLITGASEGIGAACAEAFRKRGARLSLTARSTERLAAVAGTDALVTPGDLTSEAVRQQVVERTLERHGAIDILVNNAGRGLYAPSWQVPLEQVRELFELNVFALWDLTRRVVPVMRRQRRGTVVNVSSIAGKVTLPWMTAYSASKFAVDALTDGLRMELRQDGVHAMGVYPGYILTRFQQNVIDGRPPQKVRDARRFAITAEQCATDIVRGVERDARVVVTPRSGWLLVAAERVLPAAVHGRMARMLEAQAGGAPWS